MNAGRRRGRRRGFALMLVIVTTTLVLSAWALANRRTAALLRLRLAHAERLASVLGAVVETSDPAREALARALGLMETGDPPLEDDPDTGEMRPYLCRRTAPDEAGGPVEHVVRFAPDPSEPGRWTIEAIPADQWPGEPPLEEIPAMPSTFAGSP